MYLECVKTLWRLRLLAVPPLGKLIAITSFLAGDKGAGRLPGVPTPSLGPSDLEIRPSGTSCFAPLSMFRMERRLCQRYVAYITAAQQLLMWADGRIASEINQSLKFISDKSPYLKNN